MNIQKILAIALIIAGSLGLAYGGFSYTENVHKADLGSLQLSLNEKQYVSVPVWAGVGAIVFGGLLLVMRRKS